MQEAINSADLVMIRKLAQTPYINIKKVYYDDTRMETWITSALASAPEQYIVASLTELISLGADITLPRGTSSTSFPPFHSIYTRTFSPDVRKALVELWIATGFDPHAYAVYPNGHTLSSLALASRFCDDAAVEYLIGAGADVDFRDDLGMTAIMYVAWKPRTPDCVAVAARLLAEEADLTFTGLNGWRAIDWAEAYDAPINNINVGCTKDPLKSPPSYKHVQMRTEKEAIAVLVVDAGSLPGQPLSSPIVRCKKKF